MAKKKYVAYVGSYTYTGKAKGITIFDVDVEKGLFKRRDEIEVANPSDIMTTHDRKVLYSIADEGVISFRIQADGSLEKIYLQMLMNFTMMPDEMYVTARRSGYPKVGSKLLPMVKFQHAELTAIPRRFEFTEPAPTDIMHDIRMASFQEQGITAGKNQSGMGFATTTVLNTERLWQDKNAPQWGSGK